jgi:signal transduction histidine kinase/CheY-like chemotaxis protein
MGEERFAEISDSSVDYQPESVFLGGLSERFRRGFSRESAMRMVVATVAACALVELSTRCAHAMGWIGVPVREAFGFITLTLVCGSALYVFSLVHARKLVRHTILVGVLFLLCFEVDSIAGKLSGEQGYSLQGAFFQAHALLGQALAIAGGLCLMAGFYFALLENESVLHALNLERKRLSENIAARKHAKRALKEAHRLLELKVEQRTAELAHLNEQLRGELGERKRAEAALGLRLRYEEGLATCSHALLSGSDADDSLSRALHHLLSVAGASRVYTFENFIDERQGLCMRLMRWATLPELRPQCPPDQEIRLAYSDGLERWRIELSQGRPVEGTIEALPTCEQAVLERFGIQSLVLLPIGWEGGWRGFLGLDDVRIAHGWSRDEIRVLQTAAEMVSACKERQRAEASLLAAYDGLERRVADRTSDLTRANAQLQQEMAVRRRAEAEKARLESQLSQAQKMQAIGTLAGGIAHDFNNILASIIGYTELTLRRIDSGSPFVRNLEEILKAGNRAKELVRQILVFSRQREKEGGVVHVPLIAKDVAAQVRAMCPANIEVREDIDMEAGSVFADPVEMHQIFTNLCANAQYAMRDVGGVLAICVKPVRIETERRTALGTLQPGPHIKITVSDTGHGIDPFTIDRIFEPFFTTKGVGEGTGMGLAIVHGIVTALQGAVTVQSDSNKGTVFEVFLPQYQNGAHGVELAANETLRGNEHILVVDDEQQLVRLWTELLEKLGYRVTPCADSIEALGLFRSAPGQFDLALLDHAMPRMTGMELAKAMLEARPEMPVIVATGFSESITPEQAADIGISDFVHKPILGTDLGIAVRKALDAARNKRV